MRRFAAQLAIPAALAALVLAALPSAASAHCGGRYGQFIRGHAAVLILKQRGLSCRTVRTVGLRLLGGAHVPGRIDGLMCRRDPHVHAGGGAVRCTNRRKLVEFGFE
jgi:hypothetical protein